MYENNREGVIDVKKEFLNNLFNEMIKSFSPEDRVNILKELKIKLSEAHQELIENLESELNNSAKHIENLKSMTF